jgi:hypothetical protein
MQKGRTLWSAKTACAGEIAARCTTDQLDVLVQECVKHPKQQQNCVSVYQRIASTAQRTDTTATLALNLAANRMSSHPNWQECGFASAAGCVKRHKLPHTSHTLDMPQADIVLWGMTVKQSAHKHCTYPSCTGYIRSITFNRIRISLKAHCKGVRGMAAALRSVRQRKVPRTRPQS